MNFNIRECGGLPVMPVKHKYDVVDTTIDEAFEARFGAAPRAVVHCGFVDVEFERVDQSCVITIKCTTDDNPAIIIMEGAEPSFIVNISKSIMRACDIYRVGRLRGKRTTHNEIATLVLRLAQFTL